METNELLATITRARLTALAGVHPVQIAGTITDLCQSRGLVLGDPPYDHVGDIRLVDPNDTTDTPVHWVDIITGEVI